VYNNLNQNSFENSLYIEYVTQNPFILKCNLPTLPTVNGERMYSAKKIQFEEKKANPKKEKGFKEFEKNPKKKNLVEGTEKKRVEKRN
jgi:hypothetical protein